MTVAYRRTHRGPGGTQLRERRDTQTNNDLLTRLFRVPMTGDRKNRPTDRPTFALLSSPLPSALLGQSSSLPPSLLSGAENARVVLTQ